MSEPGGKGRSVLVHRYVWAQAHGPVPARSVVHHKDGDRLNNDLENLELMRRGQHNVKHQGQRYGMPRSASGYSTKYYRQNTVRLRAQARARYQKAREEVPA